MSTPQRLVAVDVETTGFSRHNLVVEIAVVEVDPDDGRVVDEFETLINPLRDIGPVHVHGVTAEERNALRDCAVDLGINDAQVERVHLAYFNSIVAAALRDHIVTPQERLMIERVAFALNIPEPAIPEVTELPSAGAIELGTRVCFTGSAIVDGASVSGETMEEVAADAGLEPVSRVRRVRVTYSSRPIRRAVLARPRLLAVGTSPLSRLRSSSPRSANPQGCRHF